MQRGLTRTSNSNMRRRASRGRFGRGASIAEFGPALGLLLLGIFFPLIDMIMVGFSYCNCLTLNSLQTQKAAEVSIAAAKDPAGVVCLALPQAWQHTGMGAFVNLTEPPSTAIDYAPVAFNQADKFVIVTTTFSVRPFLNIPLIPSVPGLSAPVSFTISARRIVEDPTS